MYSVFIYIAIILLTTKLGGVLSRKIKMPQVLGALVAGVIIGPSVLGIMKPIEMSEIINKIANGGFQIKSTAQFFNIYGSISIKVLADIGVIMLMFLAGLETDLKEFKKAGLSSFLIAVGGVIVPLVFGTLSAYTYDSNFWENIFIGVILTATSVSISVQTLNELGKLNTRAGMNILGAAVIDDVIGLLVVSFVLSLAKAAQSTGSSAANVTTTLLIVGLKVLVFCIGSVLVVIFLPKLLDKYMDIRGKSQRTAIFGIALALVFGYIAEKLGIASITGAYVCGLMLSSVKHKEYIQNKVYTISTYFFTPIFFASVGLSTNLRNISSSMILLTLLMLITAILGKIIGCGGAAKLYGMTKSESIQIGMGMISRGEVALITTTLGQQAGIISDKFFTPTLVVVVITTLVTPILLKLSFSHRHEAKG